MKEVSYITLEKKPGDELPIRIVAYEGNEPKWYGAGQTVDGALKRIVNFTGQSVEMLSQLLYIDEVRS
jgi:hypothetical protein